MVQLANQRAPNKSFDSLLLRHFNFWNLKRFQTRMKRERRIMIAAHNLGSQNFLLIACEFEISLRPLPRQTASTTNNCLKLEETFDSKNILFYFENIKFHLWRCAVKVSNQEFHRGTPSGLVRTRQTHQKQLANLPAFLNL